MAGVGALYVVALLYYGIHPQAMDLRPAVRQVLLQLRHPGPGLLQLRFRRLHFLTLAGLPGGQDLHGP